MEIVGIQCSGCGSSNVYIDHVRRVIKCNQCGKEEAYTRASMNANNKVVFSVENALRFFKEGRYNDAKKYAYDALNISKDNVPALFIIAFQEEFIERRSGAMKRFFSDVQEVLLEYDELKELRELIVAGIPRLSEFEPDIITLVATNMQTKEDEGPLCEFIDTICPYFIMKRPSINYLTRDMVDLYTELAEHCNIPKTCFALLKSLETNPESPFVKKDFYLGAKAKYFYDNYLLQIGDIIDSIRNKEVRAKFKNAYLQKRTAFENELHL